MKSLRLHLAALLLLCCSSWACAASYLVCNAVLTGNVNCSTTYHWVPVGTQPASTQSIYSNSAANGTGVANYLAYNYVGSVVYSVQCSVQAADFTGSGLTSCQNAGGTMSYTSMMIYSPVSCVPSSRTIDPCPSGYAPSSVTVGGSASDPYSSAFEKLPLQDLIYAACVTMCGLLGIAVGSRLL